MYAWVIQHRAAFDYPSNQSVIINFNDRIWVMRGAGLTLSGASIRHIDRDFILTREGDYEGLFFNAEIMGEVEDIAAERGRVVEAARTVLTGPEPKVSMGAHCTSPFECEFTAYCGRDLPPGPQWPLEC